MLDLAGDAAASAQHAEFEVLVASSVGHVAAGEEHVAIVDDDNLGVEPGTGEALGGRGSSHSFRRG